MSETGDSLVIDSVAWHIEEMSGRLLKLDYLEDLRAKTEDTESSDEVADNGHYYLVRFSPVEIHCLSYSPSSFCEQ